MGPSITGAGEPAPGREPPWSDSIEQGTHHLPPPPGPPDSETTPGPSNQTSPTSTRQGMVNVPPQNRGPVHASGRDAAATATTHYVQDTPYLDDSSWEIEPESSFGQGNLSQVVFNRAHSPTVLRNLPEPRSHRLKRRREEGAPPEGGPLPYSCSQSQRRSPEQHAPKQEEQKHTATQTSDTDARDDPFT